MVKCVIAIFGVSEGPFPEPCAERIGPFTSESPDVVRVNGIPVTDLLNENKQNHNIRGIS